MARVLRPVSEALQWTPPHEQAFGSIGWLVPWSSRFSSFVRILHPASNYPREGLTWQQIASDRGTELTPESQFSDISGPDSIARAWLGDMGHDSLKRLAELLVSDGNKPCIYGLWEGDAWVSESADGIDIAGDSLLVDGAAWAEAANLECPSKRQHRLFTGQLSDLGNLVVAEDGQSWHRQPTLLWAEDFSLCLATDPDYDSSILAAPAALCQLILDAENIEALPVNPDTSLLAH